MADKIITRPATDEYRQQWEKIFGRDKTTRPDIGNGYDSGPPSCGYDQLPSEAAKAWRVRVGAHGCVVIDQRSA